ncbi:MAG: hypothetical protein PHN49_06035 [Candidatus Omnitrophica bacterium]|nr:hypothetical protein [Candidatus Omnitrophota bacterium]MDD5671178.1 hypothetical protein [Candidatus Omnitrophota bacterium]
MKNSKPFYVIISVNLLVLGIFVLAFLTWNTWSSYWSFRTARAEMDRVASWQKQISQFDQFLTTFARLGAATGNSRWEEHYTQYLLRREEAIERMKRFSGDILASPEAIKMNQAKLAVSNQETDAFNHARKGRTDLADLSVYGEDYDTQKEIYEKAFAAIAGKVQAGFKQQLTVKETITWHAVLIGGFFILIFAMMYFAVLIILDRYYLQPSPATVRG